MATYKRTSVYKKPEYNKPKYMFSYMLKKIERLYTPDKEYSLLDIGGASGAFCHYIISQHKNVKATVLEYDNELCKIGKKNVTRCTFINGDALNIPFSPEHFDVVTSLGVLSIFDDFEEYFNESFRVVKKGGVLLLIAQFNESPVDALIQYRYSGQKNWNRGYNLFSKESISSYLDQRKDIDSYYFERFELPFDLEPQDDPIRTWTETDGSGQKIFRNGIMPINLQTLTVKIKK